MAKQKEKEIVYENPYKLAALLLISWGFTVMGIWERYLSGFLFFGLCAVVFTWPLIDPRKRIIFTGTKAFKAQIDKEFYKRLADPGIFTYTEEGFELESYGDVIEIGKHINWPDIRAMFAYKLDKYSTDLICLDVFCDYDNSFRVDEETRGWYIFLEKIAEHFPSIDKQWHIDITVPAFETKLTLIYERDGLALNEAEGIYYKHK